MPDEQAGWRSKVKVKGYLQVWPGCPGDKAASLSVMPVMSQTPPPWLWPTPEEGNIDSGWGSRSDRYCCYQVSYSPLLLPPTWISRCEQQTALYSCCCRSSSLLLRVCRSSSLRDARSWRTFTPWDTRGTKTWFGPGLDLYCQNILASGSYLLLVTRCHRLLHLLSNPTHLLCKLHPLLSLMVTDQNWR